ncbi:Rdx family protein [Bacillus tianshenii]|nr:Rdx family protein [Bacillus tianshenii]
MFNHFRADITELVLIPGTGGAFEVVVNGEEIYSKLETGTFPDFEEMIRVIEEMKK